MGQLILPTSDCLLTRNEVEEASKAVAKVQKEWESKFLKPLFRGVACHIHLLVGIHRDIHKVM